MNDKKNPANTIKANKNALDPIVALTVFQTALEKLQESITANPDAGVVFLVTHNQEDGSPVIVFTEGVFLCRECGNFSVGLACDYTEDHVNTDFVVSE